MATLGAELGCERYLASTVVTGSGQRSSTLLAELCLSTVLVLALLAFHCRPRSKKRARCTARVTSRMVDASRSSRGGRRDEIPSVIFDLLLRYRHRHRPCCARAASGHAAAAPPSNVMNSRRRTCCPQNEDCTLPHGDRKYRVVHHSKFRSWVKSGKAQNEHIMSTLPPKADIA